MGENKSFDDHEHGMMCGRSYGTGEEKGEVGDGM